MSSHKASPARTWIAYTTYGGIEVTTEDWVLPVWRDRRWRVVGPFILEAQAAEALGGAWDGS